MIKYHRHLIFCIILCCFAEYVYSQSEQPAEKIYEIVNSSVVVVLAYDTSGNQYQGSGIVISSDGFVATNYHVCKDASRFEINHYNKGFYDIEIFQQDIDKDILILKVNNLTLPAITPGKSTNLKPGQRLYAVGSPEGYENSISEGIVSGVRKDPSGNNLIQMTTPITDGSSGGAVVNSKGELVGMSMSGQHEGSIYFAVPVEDILSLFQTNIVAANEPENKPTEFAAADYLEEGKNASRNQNYEDAVFYFSKYIENHLYDSEAYQYRGNAQLKLRNYKAAIEDFNKAIASGTATHELYFYRGNAYYYSGDFSNAVIDYSRAIELAPNLAELYYNRGYAHYKLGNYRPAIDDWKSAISLKPQYEAELNAIITSIEGKNN